jgi:hypothetical protein
MTGFSYGLGAEPSNAVLNAAAKGKPIHAMIQNEFGERTHERVTVSDYTTPARPHDTFFDLLAAEIAIRRARQKGFRGDQFVVQFSTMILAVSASAANDNG